MALPSLLRMPRPKTFLQVISLRTATEFLIFTLLINKLTGLYGILALFTGYELNPLQLSHYIYSLLVLALAAYLSPSIRAPTQPFHVLALAWLYVLDAVVNVLYTALFGMGWFVLLAQHLDDSVPGVAEQGAPGKGTIEDTAGFTDPEHEVEAVEVQVKPAPGALNVGQQATAFASGVGNAGGVGSAVFDGGSLASLGVLGALWAVRFWCCFVVLAYARGVVRGYVMRLSVQGEGSYEEGGEAGLAMNPFAEGREEGQGWRGRLGRVMLAWPTKGYWLGRDEDQEEWLRTTSGKFMGSKGLSIRVPEAGVGERERRARSGTGPPVPAVGPDGAKKEAP
ncbi:hypothetical protein MBLNU230_g2997t1 [Neophaeotheca triangularis]